ncbi:MAG: Hpt domain-containing protein, partial [Spirochaetaceae bacterium]|nr:Hpt domain-containing protein [Spirochaetaceae bacterium]
QNGFDGFIAKPIDIRELNAALNTFVRDRHPREAQMYTGQEVTSGVTSGEIDILNASKAIRTPKLLQIFCRDAEKAIGTLRETKASGDIKLLTTTVHAMKSALANIGETEISAAAYGLEKAGTNGDMDFIHANIEGFVKTLEVLVQTLVPVETDDISNTDIVEDTEYLKEQLQNIKTACENYDDTGAYAALDVLKEKQWKPQTKAVLEEIWNALFLHSDFDGAMELLETLDFS